jgi:hypothetical protein
MKGCGLSTNDPQPARIFVEVEIIIMDYEPFVVAFIVKAVSYS